MFSRLCCGCSWGWSEEKILLSNEAYKASPEAIKNYETAVRYHRKNNDAEYIRYLRLAAVAGLVDAQLSLGSYLIDGGINGKGKDRLQAREWFQKAEAQGSRLAPQYLARLATLPDNVSLACIITSGDYSVTFIASNEVPS